MPKHFLIGGAWKCLPVLALPALLFCSCGFHDTPGPSTTGMALQQAATQRSATQQSTTRRSTSQPSVQGPATQEGGPPDWNQVANIVGVQGILVHKTVYQITVPRDDLMVNVIGIPIPSEAGLASVFHLWFCSCGKTVVYGEFCLPDWEANDVVDALRSGGMEVTSISNLLVGAHPHMLSVRFYAEGEALHLAKTLKAALDCTGEARSVKQPFP